MYICTRLRAHVHVQSTWLEAPGLIIEANIPVQELEGQRGEGAYFREDTVILLYGLLRATYVAKIIAKLHSVCNPGIFLFILCP